MLVQLFVYLMIEKLLDAYANRIIEIQNDGTIIDFKGSYEEFMESKSA